MNHRQATWTADTYRRSVIARLFHSVRDGDFDALHDVLARDHVTEWPQSGARIVGQEAGIAAFRDWPGAGGSLHLRRAQGSGQDWSAELSADDRGMRIEVVSLIEFRGRRIGRNTDYFAAAIEQQAWFRRAASAGDPVSVQPADQLGRDR